MRRFRCHFVPDRLGEFQVGELSNFSIFPTTRLPTIVHFGSLSSLCYCESTDSEFEWFWVEGFQTKGEGLGLLIWFGLLTMNGKRFERTGFKFWDRVWTWISPKSDKKVKFRSSRWDSEKLNLIDLSTFSNRMRFQKQCFVRWNFVRPLGGATLVYRLMGIWKVLIVNPRSKSIII